MLTPAGEERSRQGTAQVQKMNSGIEYELPFDSSAKKSVG